MDYEDMGRFESPEEIEEFLQKRMEGLDDLHKEAVLKLAFTISQLGTIASIDMIKNTEINLKVNGILLLDDREDGKKIEIGISLKYLPADNSWIDFTYTKDMKTC